MGKGSRPRPLGVPLDTFSNNFENIFGKRVPTYMKKLIQEDTEDMQVRANPTGKIGTCGCGRSPTGDCIGWHGLNEKQLKEAQAKYEQKVLDEQKK